MMSSLQFVSIIMIQGIRSRSRTAILVLTLICLCSPLAALAEDKALIFAVEPSFVSENRRESWQKVMQYLSEKSGLKLKLAVPSTLAIYEEKLKTGTFDFAYMNPYFYTIASRQGGYLAFASRRSQPTRGAILAKKVEGPESIEQLNGKVIGFPHPKRFGSSIINQINLRRAGIDFERRFFNSQEQAYQAAITGEIDAVGTTLSRLDASSPETSTVLQVIWESPSYSPHPIAAQARVPLGSILKMKRAMIAMSRDKEESVVELLAELEFKNGFQAAKDSDWNDARSIDYKSLNATQ